MPILNEFLSDEVSGSTLSESKISSKLPTHILEITKITDKLGVIKEHENSISCYHFSLKSIRSTSGTVFNQQSGIGNAVQDFAIVALPTVVGSKLMEHHLNGKQIDKMHFKVLTYTQDKVQVIEEVVLAKCIISKYRLIYNNSDYSTKEDGIVICSISYGSMQSAVHTHDPVTGEKKGTLHTVDMKANAVKT
jgi:type VI protein secretion system component Hcp